MKVTILKILFALVIVCLLGIYGFVLVSSVNKYVSFDPEGNQIEKTINIPEVAPAALSGKWSLIK